MDSFILIFFEYCSPIAWLFAVTTAVFPPESFQNTAAQPVEPLGYSCIAHLCNLQNLVPRQWLSLYSHDSLHSAFWG